MTHHLLTLASVAFVVWTLGTAAFIYLSPRMFYTGVRRAVVRGFGFKAGGIPVNTLYALPALNSPSMSKSDLVLTGNRDTLYTGGGLDLGPGPLLLHVPDMAGRYYSIEFFDPWLDVFAVISRRTQGTTAGNYLISGPGWQGAVPPSVTPITSPSESVLVIGRVLVEGDSDVPSAYGLTQQIRLTPLGQR